MIPTLWTPQQKQILANYGVEIEAVNTAYGWIQHDLDSIDMPRFGPVWHSAGTLPKKRAG